jgi:type I restriction enzyme M protein
MRKEMIIDTKSRMAEVENTFARLFNYFQHTGFRREEYFVALYLLYIYQRRIDLRIQYAEDKQHLFAQLTEPKNYSLPLDDDEAHKLNDIFKPFLERLDFSGYQIVSDLLQSINRDFLDEYFPEIFDVILYKLAKAQGRYAGEYLMPMELSRFMCALADVHGSAKVYNPFAGLASFAVFLNESQDYLGQEINKNTWAIGTLRLLAHERKGKTKFVLGDSINQWNPSRIYRSSKPDDIFKYPPEQDSFDLIISNPPFGVRLPFQPTGRISATRSIEGFLIESGLEALNHDGKIVLCLSLGFLFRSGSEQALRRYLVDNDLLETVISLPSGLFMNTAVPTAVIVINKNKREQGKVRFVNALRFIEQTSSKERRLNDIELLNAISRSYESDDIRWVSNNEIAHFEYTLNVPRYFQKEFHGITLGELGTIIRSRRVMEGTKGKFVRVRNLKDDKVDFQLSVAKVEDVPLPRHAQQIEESCILMSIRWKTLKPTYFKYDGIPIFITPDLLAYKVDESQLDPAFLINELHAEYVLDQLTAFRIGEHTPVIRRDDLLSVKITLPSLQEQRAKVIGILEISTEINQLQAQRNTLAHGIGKKQFNEFASLKHTLGTPRQNILSYAEALIGFFDQNPSLELEKVNTDFKNQMGIDVRTALQAIKHDINFISELLEKGENGLQLSDYTLDLLSLQELEKVVNRLKSASYNFTVQIHSLKVYNKTQQGITANATLLKILLDNILMNAHKHGFDNKEPGNEVVIDLSLIDDNLVLEIKNNGKKFPKRWDKEKFIAKYSTVNPGNGSGLGGYDINRIIEYFNGTWDLILNEDPIYPVRFRILIPVKPII